MTMRINPLSLLTRKLDFSFSKGMVDLLAAASFTVA